MQESVASTGCSELCRPLYLTTSCFMQKKKLFWNALGSLGSKPFTVRESQRKFGHVERVKNENDHVESRPATIPCVFGGTLSSNSQLWELFRS